MIQTSFFKRVPTFLTIHYCAVDFFENVDVPK